MSNLIVKIGGDAKAFKATMRSLKGEAKVAGAAIGAGLLGPLAGVGATAGIITLGKTLLQTANDIGKGAGRLGVTTDEYQRLTEMAARAGANVEQLESAFKALSVVVTGTDKDGKQAQLTLRNIGLTLDDIRGLSPAKMFERVASAIRAIQDPTERAARAQQLFSEGGVMLMPLIMQYEQMREEVEATQKLMDGDAIAAAEKFNDVTIQIGSNIESSLVNSGLLGWLGDVAQGIDDITRANKMLADGGVKAPKVGPVLSAYESLKKGLSDWVSYSRGIIPEATTPEVAAPTESEIAAAKVKKTSAEDDKAARKAAGEAARVASESAAVEKKRAAEAAAEEKRREAIQARTDEQRGAIGEQIAVQRLLNAGLKKEAEIYRAISEAKRKNADITESEIRDIQRLTGELFDLRQKEAEKATDANGMQALDKSDPEVTRLELIGAKIDTTEPAQRKETGSKKRPDGGATEVARPESRTDEQRSAMAEQISLQGVVNAELNREAAILAAIADARRKNADITEAEIRDIKMLTAERLKLIEMESKKPNDATVLPALDNAATEVTPLDQTGAKIDTTEPAPGAMAEVIDTIEPVQTDRKIRKKRTDSVPIEPANPAPGAMADVIDTTEPVQTDRTIRKKRTDSVPIETAKQVPVAVSETDAMVDAQSRLNAGLTDEADIRNRINSARRESAALTNSDIRELIDLLGSDRPGRFSDLRSQPVTGSASTSPNKISMALPIAPNVAQAGAVMGAPGSPDPKLAIQRDLRKLSEQQLRTLTQIRDAAGWSLERV